MNLLENPISKEQVILLLFSSVPEYMQSTVTIANIAKIILLIFLLVVVLRQLYKMRIKNLQAGNDLGPVRFRLPPLSDATARQSRDWIKVMQFALGFFLGGAVGFAVGIYSTLGPMVYAPFVMGVWWSSSAAAHGRQDRHRWIEVLAGISICLGGIGVMCVVSTGELFSVGFTSRILDSLLFCLALSSGMFFGVMTIIAGFQSCTLVSDYGFEDLQFPIRRCPCRWSELKRYQWHDDGEDFVLVVAIPKTGSAGDKGETEYMIPVPSQHREPIQEILTNACPAES